MHLTLDNLHEHAVETDGGCLLWTRGVNSKGYPQAYIDGEIRSVKRHVYRLAHGKLPKGRVVRCYCEHKRCISPLCLYAQTHAQRAADVYCTSVRIRRALEALRAQKTKLTPAKVAAIRQSDAPDTALADEHGVSARTVRRVRDHATWRAAANASVFTWRPAA